jgi:hypothetical protein
VPIVVANTIDQGRRHALDASWRSAVAGLNGLRKRRMLTLHERAADLGYGDYTRLWDELHGLRLEWLTVQALLLLSSTEDIYRDQLTRALSQHGLEYGAAWKADLAWLFRASEFDVGFAPSELLPAVHRTVRDIGFTLEDQKHITLDLKSRPAKSSRAFCAPIEIPGDVRLVFKPMGGRNDYETLLHEVGHAEHFANMDPALPFGFRWLGDAALTEGFAFLLQYLTAEPIWLRRHLDWTSEAYRHLGAVHKLYMVRRYATKIVYEVELHHETDRLQPLQERYVELFSRNLGVQYGPEEFLADVDDELYAAQYLRAWIFEGQLRAYLKREFDEEWFRSQKAGRFLLDLWRDGQRYTVDELVRFMGYDDLSMDPMLAEIRDVLER